MASALLPIGLVAVGVMGFATQRGSTCTVAAIEQIVSRRRYDRLLALIDASLWVGCGFALLNACGLLPAAPIGYEAGVASILGGMLFGVGAKVNRACTFGSIARLGSGEWAYLATPAGYYFGLLATSHWPVPQRARMAAPLLDLPGWAALPAAALLIAGFVHRLRRGGDRGTASRDPAWPPHVASAVIGLGFLVATVTIERWTYTDFLSELAQGTVRNARIELLLSFLLLAGAVLGGWTGRRLKLVPPDLSSVVRCLAGGAIMGGASRLIPGGNTSLVLADMPLLWPYAWIAFTSMCVTILVLARLRKWLAARSLEQAERP